jgi:hypothetical protein
MAPYTLPSKLLTSTATHNFNRGSQNFVTKIVGVSRLKRGILSQKLSSLKYYFRKGKKLTKETNERVTEQKQSGQFFLYENPVEVRFDGWYVSNSYQLPEWHLQTAQTPKTIYGNTNRVSDPYSFFTDPDPDDPDGGQYGSGSNPDPGL